MLEVRFDGHGESSIELTLFGRLVEPFMGSLRDSFHNVYEPGVDCIFDLSNVSEIDHRGIGLLMELQSRIHNSCGQAVFVQLNEGQVYLAFLISGLLNAVEVVDSKQAALDLLEENREKVVLGI